MRQWLIAFGLLVPGLALAAVNLNTAAMEELVALPGIGPAKAQAIIDHRKAHGPFKSVEELKDVKGIGAKRFEKIKPDLAVTGASTGVRSVTKAGGEKGKGTRPENVAAGKRDAAAAKP